MKTVITTAVLATACGFASAATYNDATNDLFENGFAHLDIASVEMTNDATWLYISVTARGDLDSSNWGKYALGIDNGQGGPSDNSNGWGRNIDWGRGITHWTATWADDGGSGAGGEVYAYTGSWSLLGATWMGSANISATDAGHAAGTQTWQILLSDLGVGIGDTFFFDVITTANGGGDPGVDHLSRADQATSDWSVQSVSGDFLSYTVVPAPGALALVGVGGLVAARRRR